MRACSPRSIPSGGIRMGMPGGVLHLVVSEPGLGGSLNGGLWELSEIDSVIVGYKYQGLNPIIVCL